MINVSDTSKYNVSSSVNGTVVMSSLTIKNTQSSDVGTYTCQAENFIGFHISSGILTVNGMQYINKYLYKYNILIKLDMQSMACTWFVLSVTMVCMCACLLQ